MIRCYLLSQNHAAPASPEHPIVGPHPFVQAHQAYRRKRRIRRAIVIACISIGTAGAAIALPPILYPPPPPPPAAERSGSALPESGWENPNSATRTPIPEPGSASLLAPAAVAALIWRLGNG